MSDALVTQRQLETLLQRLALLEQRLDRTVVGERLGYSESSYVPTYTGATTAGATTYTAQDGAYIQVGNAVLFRGRVIWTAATGTGQAQISLPVTSVGVRGAVAIWTQNVTFANSAPQGRVVPGSSVFLMDSPLTNAASTNINVEAAGEVWFSGTIFLV